MKKFLLQQKPENLLLLLVMVFILYGWYVFCLALFGVFLFPLVLVGGLFFGGAALFLTGRLLAITPPDFRVAFGLVFLYAVFIFFISVPTLLSGRDQGSISEAAYRLAQNGTLHFSHPAARSFFEIYGPGTALNFPGFSYTESGDLLTQFPLGYTAYAGSLVALFGLAGFSLTNTLFFFLSLLILYSLLRLFAAPFYAFFGLALASLSFLPAWFVKSTLSENLALFLFLSLLLGLFHFLQNRTVLPYAAVLGSAGLFAFTRIEGFVLLGLTFALLASHKETRIFWRKNFWASLLLPGLLFFFLFLRDFFINLPYFKMIGRAFFKFLHGFGSDVVYQTSFFSGGSASQALGSVFFSYGLLLLFAVGFFSLLVFAKEKKYRLLVPALVALPTFLYLYAPSITPDHPWMLRRFLFTLFPVFLFSTVLGMALLFAKKNEKTFPLARPSGYRLIAVSLVFLGLLSVQWPAWVKSIAFAENRGALAQISDFTQRFGERDLILVDRFATGSGFAMLSGPAQYLSGKNIAYFFNPEDITRLDSRPYEHVYLVAPIGESARYRTVLADRLIEVGRFTFVLEQFENESLKNQAARFPEKKILRTDNLIFEIKK